MSKLSGSQSVDRRHAVLRRLILLGKPATFMDIGYLCGPETIRTLAIHGYIEVKISIKPKGEEVYQHGLVVRKKRALRARRAKSIVPVHVSHIPMCDFAKDDSDGVDGLPPNKQEAA